MTYRIRVQDGRVEVWSVFLNTEKYVGWFNSVECAIEWVDGQQRQASE